ncbi:hypothetical protein RO3G_06913 [Rhizopus delemar RA 99-880]|uniref:Uncharacterized protein n=1 Tax=Rhizopus delemar (strain RA 99-880 / ATCC MYA-4621 / FGSC 9543 / NRRL 43880) TaxID=246409 RepID=I1C178_RHIO9|nr:hypothetical protein RO3G_06913 [Rhizopus delemar RA 99-880]|eukprot:EIE82208.1 hypothetical protein RO3G_06913 [Rhizopus delemar RA 99-880]
MLPTSFQNSFVHTQALAYFELTILNQDSWFVSPIGLCIRHAFAHEKRAKFATLGKVYPHLFSLGYCCQGLQDKHKFLKTSNTSSSEHY